MNVDKFMSFGLASIREDQCKSAADFVLRSPAFAQDEKLSCSIFRWRKRRSGSLHERASAL
jgi:hypothetical protein